MTVLTSKREGRKTITLDEFFPPDDHRYLTDEQVEEMRQVALSGDNVVLSPRLAMELISDWRNMSQEIIRVRDYAERMDALAEERQAALNQIAAHIRQEDTASGAPPKSGWFG